MASPKRKLWPERSVHIVSHYPVLPPGHPDLQNYGYQPIPPEQAYPYQQPPVSPL